MLPPDVILVLRVTCKEFHNLFPVPSGITKRCYQNYQHLLYPGLFQEKCRLERKWKLWYNKRLCSSCMETHPKRLFSAAELAKPAEERICRPFKRCTHYVFKQPELRRLLAALRQADRGLGDFFCDHPEHAPRFQVRVPLQHRAPSITHISCGAIIYSRRHPICLLRRIKPMALEPVIRALSGYVEPICSHRAGTWDAENPLYSSADIAQINHSWMETRRHSPGTASFSAYHHCTKCDVWHSLKRVVIHELHRHLVIHEVFLRLQSYSLESPTDPT